MAYDEKLAQRVRRALKDEAVTEKKMFGGICFLLNGAMLCGVTRDTLMLRVGPDAYATLLHEPGAREMDFTGKPMKGMLYVAPDAVADARSLSRWIARAVAFVGTLPSK
ncbi:MAG: TfoX/Sxy family protein [Nitrospinae bacterium]|nr:TfoX/Sxy family protein [Nitrospinota bacterium]